MADISKIDNGTEYNLKDATARAGIESSKTLKSSVVTVNDAAPINAEDITVDITPVQDLHGYDRPWAGGGWKNKLPMTVDILKSLNTGGTWSGNVYTINNATIEILTDTDENVIGIKANGTPNDLLYFFLAKNDQLAVLNGKTVVLNGSIGGDNSKYLIQATGYNGINSVASRNGDSVVFTPTSVFDSVRIIIWANVSVNNQIFYPMIRLSTETDPTFAPYSNICPIEGRTGAGLDRVEGYFDGRYPNIDTSVKYRAIQVGNGTFTMSSDANGNNSFALLFFLAGNVSSGASSANNGVYNGHPVTVTTNDGYVTVGYRTGAVETQTPVGTHTKIEKGAVATPYQGQQYTINFGETVYGGTVDFNTGVMTVTHISASDTWGNMTNPVDRGGGITSKALSLGTDIMSTPLQVGGLCNVTNREVSNTQANIHWYTAYTNAIVFLPSDTDNDMVIQVLCQLATPTAIQLTPQQIQLLKGINTVYADCGDTQLKYQPDNVIGELKGEIQKANSFVSKMALRQGSGAKDFSYGGWSFRLYIYRSMGQISMSVERISASSVTEQAVVKTFNGESDYRAPEDLRPIFSLIQAATYTTPSGWALQVYLTDEGYIMFTGMAPAVGASAPTSSNWNLVEPWATHQQAKDLFNN